MSLLKKITLGKYIDLNMTKGYLLSLRQRSVPTIKQRIGATGKLKRGFSITYAVV